MCRSIIVLTILLSLLVVCASASTTITVRPSSSVKASEMVKLGEIATVTGAKEDVERLNQVEIARSAVPGAARQITPGWIKTRITCAGFDAKALTIKAPLTVILVSESQQVKGADIIETAKQFITSQLSQSDLTYTLSETGTQPDSLVPAGKLELVAEESNRPASPGRQNVTVDVLVDGSLYTKKTVGLNIKASGSVLVASQSIKAKEPLTASNTRMEQRDLPSASVGYLSAIPDDGEKIASRSISAGMPITGDMLATKPAVLKGDSVIVSVRTGGVKVVVKGTASQDGLVGDDIRVSVPTSREEIHATVTQPGLVEVRI